MMLQIKLRFLLGFTLWGLVSEAMEPELRAFNLEKLTGNELQRRQTLHNFLTTLPSEVFASASIPPPNTPSQTLIACVKEANHAIRLNTLTVQNETLLERIGRLEEDLRGASNQLQVKQSEIHHKKTQYDNQIESLTTHKLRLENQLQTAQAQVQTIQQQLHQGRRVQEEEKIQLKTEITTLKEKKLDLENKIETAQQQLLTTKQQLQHIIREKDESETQRKREIKSLTEDKVGLETQLRVAEEESHITQQLLEQVKNEQAEERAQLETEIKLLTEDKSELESKIEAAQEQAQQAWAQLEQVKNGQVEKEKRLTDEINLLTTQKLALEEQFKMVEDHVQTTQQHLIGLKKQQTEERVQFATSLDELRDDQSRDKKELVSLQNALKEANYQLQLKQEELQKAKNDHQFKTEELEKKILILNDSYSATMQELTHLRGELQVVYEKFRLNQEELIHIQLEHSHQRDEVTELRTQLSKTKSKFKEIEFFISQQKDQSKQEGKIDKEELIEELFKKMYQLRPAVQSRSFVGAELHRPRRDIPSALAETERETSPPEEPEALSVTPLSLTEESPSSLESKLSEIGKESSQIVDSEPSSVAPTSQLETPHILKISEPETPQKQKTFRRGFFNNIEFPHHRAVVIGAATAGFVIGSVLFIKFIWKPNSQITIPKEIKVPEGLKTLEKS
ncbi:MAG: hypothetical protein K0M45_07625 [Candidatus Paracaedibacteraceae bacterium]|nr:hypothetical protein [Candidatus Paracaedibacteraceae bacterium]